MISWGEQILNLDWFGKLGPLSAGAELERWIKLQAALAEILLKISPF